MGSDALSHIRICDFTGQLAGAGATRFLAAMGAQVIRIEDPTNEGRWDILRGMTPFVDDRRGNELGGGFNNHNVEKLGITLNLRTERGKELLSALVAVSDAVTENYAAGVLDRWGFGYDRLREIRDDIIYVSNCGFGHTGPYREFKTWGPIVQACCGLTFLSGQPDMPPAGWGYSYMDHHGGNMMAVAILAGLVHRTRTGEGQWIDMACTEAGATLLGPTVLDHSVNGRPARRAGMPDSNHSQHPAMAPHGIYPADAFDDWVAIACRDDRDWRALAGVIAEPWADDERFSSRDGRMAAQDDLDAGIARWTSAINRDAAVAAIRAVGVPCSPVQRPNERIDDDANTEAWGLWPEVTHREMGTVRVDGIPAHFSETDWSIERSAPCLGQDNEAVYGGILGLGSAEIAELTEEGVL